MAVDLQVVFPNQVISVSSFRELPGYDPRSIDIYGDDFSSVNEVLINEDPAPNFHVLGLTRMIAQVPEVIGDRDIYDIRITSNRLTFSARSLFKFQIGKSPRRVTGMMRLLQLFIKVLFTSPGSDIGNKGLGGGLLTLISNLGVDGNDGRGIIGDLTIAVDNTTRQIVAAQAGNHTIPPNERLLSAEVTETRYNQEDLSVEVTVELINHTGIRGYANVLL